MRSQVEPHSEVRCKKKQLCCEQCVKMATSGISSKVNIDASPYNLSHIIKYYIFNFRFSCFNHYFPGKRKSW